MKSTWIITFKHKEHDGIKVVITVSTYSTSSKEVAESLAKSRFRHLVAPGDGTLNYTTESVKRLF